MKTLFFQIPCAGGSAQAEELNRVLASERIVFTDRRFVADGANSFWAICIGVEGRAAFAKGGGKPAEKVDYRDILSPEDFAIYARLRDLRKQVAQRDGVPPYAVFTNDQLAAIVQQKASSKAAIGNIEGVGPARVDKYADLFLKELNAGPSLNSRPV